MLWEKPKEERVKNGKQKNVQQNKINKKKKIFVMDILSKDAHFDIQLKSISAQ